MLPTTVSMSDWMQIHCCKAVGMSARTRRVRSGCPRFPYDAAVLTINVVVSAGDF